MTDIAKLKELRERVIAAKGPDGILQTEIRRKICPDFEDGLFLFSVDAALALVERVLPGCGSDIFMMDPEVGAAVQLWPKSARSLHGAFCRSAPLAILSALLGALIAQADAEWERRGVCLNPRATGFDEIGISPLAENKIAREMTAPSCGAMELLIADPEVKGILRAFHKGTKASKPFLPGAGNYGECERLRVALEPFGDIDGEGDEDFGDDTPVTIQFGRTTANGLTLGDLRRARATLIAQAERAGE